MGWSHWETSCMLWVEADPLGQNGPLRCLMELSGWRLVKQMASGETDYFLGCKMQDKGLILRLISPIYHHPSVSNILFYKRGLLCSGLGRWRYSPDWRLWWCGKSEENRAVQCDLWDLADAGQHARSGKRCACLHPLDGWGGGGGWLDTCWGWDQLWH